MSAHTIGTIIGILLGLLIPGAYFLGYWRGARMATDLGKKHMDQMAAEHIAQLRSLGTHHDA